LCLFIWSRQCTIFCWYCIRKHLTMMLSWVLETSTVASWCNNQKQVPTTLIRDEVIKHMPPDKAPSPDSFNGLSLIKC
jgi:hypothetical protein